MLALALPLALLVGLSLGMLGGGGSILTVPLLVSVVGIAPKDAIAMSLLVVGLTSLVASLAHARQGRVLWRTGATFGVAGMLGAFMGGRLAQHVPQGILLGAFAAMMIATAIAMFRRPMAETAPSAGDTPPAPPPLLRMLAIGGAVGLVTGLVGAGGGFVVVPALVLLARVPMKTAVGTSLVVVVMNSLAGFAGHLTHAQLDGPLTLAFSAVGVAGSLVGSRLAARVPQQLLRQLFAWFVLAMAALLVSTQLSPAVRATELYQAVFVTRWPFWIGGSAIAGVVLFLLWWDNKLLGVSTGCAELCQLSTRPQLRHSWRIGLLAGIVIGGFVAGRLAGVVPTLEVGEAYRVLAGAPVFVRLGVLVVAGALIGYGARTANGCTSGHSIVGVALGGRASMVATAAFMLAGFATTQVIYGVLS